jgi:hypothetical protein
MSQCYIGFCLLEYRWKVFKEPVDSSNFFRDSGVACFIAKFVNCQRYFKDIKEWG